MATINRPGKSIATSTEIRESLETVYIAVVFYSGAGTFRKVYPCKDMDEAEKAVDCFRSFSDVDSATILGI